MESRAENSVPRDYEKNALSPISLPFFRPADNAQATPQH